MLWVMWGSRAQNGPKFVSALALALTQAPARKLAEVVIALLPSRQLSS